MIAGEKLNIFHAPISMRQWVKGHSCIYEAIWVNGKKTKKENPPAINPISKF